MVAVVGMTAPQWLDRSASSARWSSADTTRLLQLQSCAEKVMCSLTYGEQSELNDLHARKPSYMDEEVRPSNPADDDGEGKAGGGFVDMLQQQAAQNN